METLVEDFRFVAVNLELSGTCDNESLDIWFVVCNEMLCKELATFADVVVSLFLSDTGETDGRLTTAAVLFGEGDHDTLEDFFVVALECGVEDSIAVNNHKSELFVVFEQSLQRLGVEFVLALVAEHVDGLEGFQVKRNFLFCFAVVQRNHSAEEHEAIRGDAFVELQL